VLLFSSVAFNILDAPPFRALLRKWMPGVKRIPSRRAMSGPVLQRLLAILTTNAKLAYSKGSYVSLSFHGWKSTANRKLLGMITELVDMSTGKVAVDFRGTREITALAETTGLIVGQVELELAKALSDNDYLPPLSSGGRDSACASVLTSIVRDSASCNVGAKLEFSRRFPSIVMVACMALQLNLLTVNIVTHPALKSAAGQCSKVVMFFKQSTKYRGLLEELMTVTLGHIMSLVQRGETRWLSHHGVVQRLLKLKPALVAFRDRYHSDRALRSTANGATVVELLRSPRFWDQAELVSHLLRPIVVELGIIERRNGNLSDVCATFGRLFAYFQQLKRETAATAADGTVIASLFAVAADPTMTAVTHQVCGSALGHLQWRQNRYYDAPLLAVAHLLDPKRHTAGLTCGKGGVAERSNLLRLFLALARRFGPPEDKTVSTDACDETFKTVAAFSRYLEGGSKELLMYNDQSGGAERIGAVHMWQLCSTFAGTALSEVAKRLLSIPAHAAEMERVWSQMGAANSPVRNRLTTDRLTDMTRVVVHMHSETEAGKLAPRETFEPGCLMPGFHGRRVADDGAAAVGVVVGGGGQMGRAADASEQDAWGDALDAIGEFGSSHLFHGVDEEGEVNIDDDLEEIGRKLQAILEEESLSIVDGVGEPAGVGAGGRETGASAAVKTTEDLVRLVSAFVSGADSGRHGEGDREDLQSWKANVPVLLRDMFDTEWYLGNARLVNQLEQQNTREGVSAEA